MDLVIQVRNRGVITLPADLREKYGIENGDISAWSIWTGFLFLPLWCPWSLSWPVRLNRCAWRLA
jgi:hypothetical protein